MGVNKREDVVKATYDKLHNSSTEELTADAFYQYFYNLLDTGINSFQFTNVQLMKDIEEDWIAAIEEALPSLWECVIHPRRFIEEDREVVNIALARNITTESIRHLAQHSDLVDEYDEKSGTIVPNRILNVFKEESFNLYENRFICTLVAELQHFVNKRYNVIFENSRDELGSFFELESRVDNYTETIDYKLQINIRDKQDMTENESENAALFARLNKIHRMVNDLASMDFITQMRQYPGVRHPVIKTNVINKNADYRKCYELWNFIYSYDRVGYRVNLIKQEPAVSKEFEKDIFHGIIWDYSMLHHQVENARKLNIDHPKRKKQIDIPYIRQALDEIVRESDIDDTRLKKIIMNELNSIQLKYKNGRNEQKKQMQRRRRKNEM